MKSVNRKPKSTVEVACCGGNYYVIELSDCSLSGLRKLKARLEKYLNYWDKK